MHEQAKLGEVNAVRTNTAESIKGVITFLIAVDSK